MSAKYKLKIFPQSFLRSSNSDTLDQDAPIIKLGKIFCNFWKDLLQKYVLIFYHIAPKDKGLYSMDNTKVKYQQSKVSVLKAKF